MLAIATLLKHATDDGMFELSTQSPLGGKYIADMCECNIGYIRGVAVDIIPVWDYEQHQFINLPLELFHVRQMETELRDDFVEVEN